MCVCVCVAVHSSMICVSLVNVVANDFLFGFFVLNVAANDS